MSEQPPAGARKEWSSHVIGQRVLTLLFVTPGLCLCALCLATIIGSECPVDDFFFRGFLQAKPIVPLPEDARTILLDGGQGSHGGWTGGLYATEASPDEVVSFYRRVGGLCHPHGNTIYQLGGFTLDIQSIYWECDAPAKPWSYGAVIVFPQAGYINALNAIYHNPPQLSSNLSISETVVGYQLRQFYGGASFTDADWPEGGAVLETFAGWCDPF